MSRAPAALVAAWLAGGTAAAQDPGPRTVTELGRRYPLARRLVAARPAERRQSVAHLVPAGVPGEEVKYLRVLLQLEGGERGRFYLTVRDEALRPVEVLTAESFRPGGGRWTARVAGTRVVLDLDPADESADTQAVTIALREYIAMPAKATTTYYSSQVPQAPQWRELFQGGDGARKRQGDAVGFLMTSYDQTSWCCSGVVVADGVLLTNWHCGGQPGRTPEDAYWGEAACRDTLVDLSWDGDGVSREYRCVEVLCRDRELDFALLRIAPLGPDGGSRPAPARLAPPAGGERIAVIHHPECLPKRITEGCSVVHAEYRGWTDAGLLVDFSHRCDTEAGSSGGPVFDDEGRLLGLHHTGFEQSEDAVARSGKLNTAVRLDRILERLAAPGDPASCRAGLAGLVQVVP